MSKIKRIFGRAYHLLQRICRETKKYPKNKKMFGKHIAKVIFKDGIIPPGKSPEYIAEIEKFVEDVLENLISNFEFREEKRDLGDNRKVFVCWWQGEDSMPEIVKMCYRRLNDFMKDGGHEVVLITWDNYKDYVTFPQHIMEKYEKKIITMTTLSDMLRLELLSRYGGIWVDATVFLTEPLKDEFFTETFYSQKMAGTSWAQREACRSLWCGFCQGGSRNNPLYHFMKEAFYEWWKRFDDIVDYVLIDYIFIVAYKRFENIREIVDKVPNNNIGVFEMYKVLDRPYSNEMYTELTKDNYIHKLTYKIDLKKETDTKEETLYSYLLKDVYASE